MGLFDENTSDSSNSRQFKVEKLNFENIIIYSEENTWSAEITVQLFDSEGDTADGVSVDIYYSGKRFGSALTDLWGNGVIKIINIPVPELRDTPVKFEARIKGQEIRAWTDEIKVPMTKEEIRVKEKRKAEQERKRKAEQERKRKEEEEIKLKVEEERKRKAEEELKLKAEEEQKRKEKGLINIDNKFYICNHPVTQKEYYAVMDKNPSDFNGDNNPVENVSWFDAVKYCNERSIKEGLKSVYNINGTNVKWDKSKIGYRLPTEAEWKYAAKGGSRSKGYKYSGSNNIDEVAWHRDNSDKKTHPVKGKKANEIGLYDMSGNVWEWCWDWYTIGARVLRGGGWQLNAERCTVSYRYGLVPAYGSNYTGFRVALSQVKKQAGI